MFQSPLVPWSDTLIGVDSANYFYDGSRLLAGDTPYVDFFEHKGPLIMLVNAVGQALAGKAGVALIEWLFILVAASLAYATVRDLFGPLAAGIAVVAMEVEVGYQLHYGNRPEEYVLPFAVLALALLVRFVVKGKLGWLASIGFGATFALAFAAKITSAPLWAAFCLTIVVMLIAQRRWLDLGVAAGGFVAGAAAVIAPIVIWLASKGALGACYDQMIVFNAEYASRKTAELAARVGADWLGDFTVMVAVGVTGALLVWAIKHRRDADPKRGIGQIALLGGKLTCGQLTALTSANLAALMSLLICVSLPGRVYEFYLMLLVPCYLLPMAFVWRAVVTMARGGLTSSMVACIATFAMVAWSVYPHLADVGVRVVISAVNKVLPAQQAVTDVVKTHSQPGATVQVYGNESWIYLESGRTAATRFQYLATDGGAPDAFTAEINEAIRQARPELVVDINGGFVSAGLATGYEQVSTSARDGIRYDIYVRR
jgi:hypothetical protein